jgi:hypothetical protein
MIRSFPVICLLGCILLSCSNGSKTDKEIIKAMEESLEQSNRRVSFSTETILRSLQEKTLDPATSYKAELWFPKADQVAKLSASCLSYIDEFKKNKGLSKELADSFVQRLKAFEEAVLKTDLLINEVFADRRLFNNDSINKKFYDQYFKGASETSIHAFLTRIQNTVKVFENKTIAFCSEQIASHRPFFDTYTVIVGQNSKVIKRGGQLEIIAGVGAFTSQAKPEIFINNQAHNIDESGYADFKQKVQLKPGNYSIPVKIIYTDEFGKKQTTETKVEYTVAKECDQ